MSKRFLWCFTALTVVFTMLLTVVFTMLLPAWTSHSDDAGKGSNALIWGTWNNYGSYKDFIDLLHETYPEVDLDFISYTGANRTGYSWAQMRADDIPDIFITSQILDEDLAKERLADLSGYPFISELSNSVLDQSAIDGGIYLLPVSYSMHGIFYNKTLMKEKGWEIPANFTELEKLCKEIQKEGLIPGIAATQLTGAPFSAVFNLAKTDWYTTPEGVNWEKDFLAGNATAKGIWENTMKYVQRYIDIGMFHTDPEDRDHDILVEDYLGNRKAVFCTAVHAINRSTAAKDGTDELGMMPYISEDGSKNVYMYNPSCYFGISKRLTEPGNEKELEDAIKILSLLFSPEGQATVLGDSSPTEMSVLDSAAISENSMIYDARQALREGRAFPMTYAHWEGVLADMGQAYKEWFRGEEGAGPQQCIERMDKLQQSYLNNAEELSFCESTADFTLEQTAVLAGKALGSSAGADAAMVPIGEFHDGVELKAGISGKLYKGKIDLEINNTISPVLDGEYAVMTMTGAQAKELAKAGLDKEEDGNPFPYILVTWGGSELENDKSYKIAFFMEGYTEEMAQTYSAKVEKGSFREFLHSYLKEQKTVSPDGNPWES